MTRNFMKTDFKIKKQKSRGRTSGSFTNSHGKRYFFSHPDFRAIRAPYPKPKKRFKIRSKIKLHFTVGGRIALPHEGKLPLADFSAGALSLPVWNFTMPQRNPIYEIQRKGERCKDCTRTKRGGTP